MTEHIPISTPSEQTQHTPLKHNIITNSPPWVYHPNVCKTTDAPYVECNAKPINPVISPIKHIN